MSASVEDLCLLRGLFSQASAQLRIYPLHSVHEPLPALSHQTFATLPLYFRPLLISYAVGSPPFLLQWVNNHPACGRARSIIVEDALTVLDDDSGIRQASNELTCSAMNFTRARLFAGVGTTSADRPIISHHQCDTASEVTVGTNLDMASESIRKRASQTCSASAEPFGL